jgi:hypothetical protein
MYVGEVPPSNRSRSGPRTSSSPGEVTATVELTRTGRSLGAGVLRGSRFNVLDQYARLLALTPRCPANSFMLNPLARHS